jgi:hypothetical protein
MWVPGGLAYVVAALFLVVRMLRESEERVRRRELNGDVGFPPRWPANRAGWGAA